MIKDEQMINKKFGKWLVLQRTEERDSHGSIKYLCKCECGKEKLVDGYSLRSGISKYCIDCKNQKRYGKKKNKRINIIYNGMKARCYNSNTPEYKNYGGRGIKMCDEWINNPQSFYDWAMDNGYEEGLSIDRIDVNGNYEPSNCRWVTKEVQDNNRRNNRKITYKGKTKTLSQWSKKYNINIVTLSDRLKAGLSIEEALNKPVIKSGGKILYTLNGETKLLSEWCKIYNINYQTAWKKSKKGYSIEKILKIEK